MAAKAIIVICAQACFIQSVFGQCFGRAGTACPGSIGPGLAGLGLAGPGLYDGLTLGAGCGVLSTRGSFPVTSASAIAPTGVNVVSENMYEGALLLEGNLPLLGSVGVEGAMGTAGAGTVSYGCGDGAVGIVAEEGPIVTGILAPGSYGPGILAPGSYSPGLAAGGLAPGFAYGPGLAYGSGLIGTGVGSRCGCGYGAIY